MAFNLSANQHMKTVKNNGIRNRLIPEQTKNPVDKSMK